MAVRFLDLYSPEIESTYASLPLEFINEKISQDQGKFDTAVAKASAMSADPIGLKEIVDQNGKPIAVEDFNRAQAWANNFNEQVANTVQDLYSSGDFSRVTPVIANLNREYAKAQSSEGILGINKARMEAYQKMHENYAQQKNMPSSIWRSNPYYDQIQLMRAKEKYVPTTSLPYSEHIDRTEVANKIISGMETNQEAWANPGNRGGKYISSGTHETRTEADIQDVFDFAINQSGLFADLSNEVEYLYKTKQEVDYLNDKGELVQGPITNQKEAQDYFNYKKGELKEFVKKKFATDKWTKNLKNDDVYTTDHKFKLENPETIFSKKVNGTTVKLNTVGEWKKVLNGTTNDYNNAVANAQVVGKDALTKLGITDPNMQMLLNANRKNLSNPDGSLNVDLFEKLTKIDVSADNFNEINDNFKVYNEALSNENNLERTKNNIETRVNIAQNKVAKDLNINDKELLKEFNNNKEYLALNGISDFNTFKEKFLNADLPTSPTPSPKKNTGQWTDKNDIQFTNPNYSIYNNFEQKINDEKVSFDASYNVLTSTTDKYGIGVINSELTKEIKGDPNTFLNSLVDGKGVPLRSLLSGKDLKKLKDGEFSIEVIANPMAVSGDRGVMLSFKGADGNPVQYPVSVEAYNTGAFDKTVNESYMRLKETLSPSELYESETFKELSTLKGNNKAGKQVYNAELYSRPVGSPEHIVTADGVHYNLRRENTGGKNYFKMSIITGDGEYELNETFENEDAILERIGQDSFRMDARNNIDRLGYEQYDEEEN